MAYADVVRAKGPSAYFPGRELTGNVVDVVGGLSGTVTGCTRGQQALPGKTGLGMANSETVGADYVTVADAAAIRATATFSVECWTQFHVQNSGVNSQVCWLNKGYTSHNPPYYEYGFFSSPVDASATSYIYDFYFTAGGAFSYGRAIGPPFVLDTPYHFVGTYDGAAATVYINGVGTSRAVSGAGSGFATPLYFGRYANVGPATNIPWHNGTVSDVAIYQRALTAAEVLSNFRTGLREGVGY